MTGAGCTGCNSLSSCWICPRSCEARASSVFALTWSSAACCSAASWSERSDADRNRSRARSSRRSASRRAARTRPRARRAARSCALGLAAAAGWAFGTMTKTGPAAAAVPAQARQATPAARSARSFIRARSAEPAAPLSGPRYRNGCARVGSGLGAAASQRLSDQTNASRSGSEPGSNMKLPPNCWSARALSPSGRGWSVAYG
jgi:hypothetical protein